METTTTIIQSPKVSGCEKKIVPSRVSAFCNQSSKHFKREINSTRRVLNATKFPSSFLSTTSPKGYCLKKLLVPLHRLQAVT